jgi:uncharacterized membrane protein YuzA (DUF378 family)
MFLNNKSVDEKAHFYVWLHIVTISLVLIGALNWGSIGFFSLNFVNKIFKKFSVYIYMLVGIAALHLAIKRDTYLTFLGWTVFPVNLLKVSQPANSNVQVEIDVKPDVVKVLYWASNPESNSIASDDAKVQTYVKAYENNENVGVAEVINGKATLHFLCPSKYSVGTIFKRTLEKHVHYRMAYPNGWLSNVYTHKVNC